MAKDVKYYLNLPYTFIIEKDEDVDGTYYYARVLELTGCGADGKTMAEAAANIKDAMDSWIKAALDIGKKIPEPSKFSGNITFRTTPDIHRELAIKADAAGARSVNHYLTTIVAKDIGAPISIEVAQIENVKRKVDCVA